MGEVENLILGFWGFSYLGKLESSISGFQGIDLGEVQGSILRVQYLIRGEGRQSISRAQGLYGRGPGVDFRNSGFDLGEA